MPTPTKILAELIKLQTADGLTHFGALYHAEKAKALGVVLVHGLTGRFVGEIESALPPLLQDAGYSCLVANNRGNGFMGAATERLAGCLPDIQAAIDFMAGRGFERIALLGHSKGGVKVTYYMARRKDPHVAALGLLSPASNVHNMYRWLAGDQDFDAFLNQAKKLVEDNQSETMLHIKDWPYFVSAGTVWDHYLAKDDDVLEQLPAIRLPILAACGGKEIDWCQVVATLLKAPPNGYLVDVVPEADHVYTGHEAELAKLIIRWLDGLKN